MPISQAGSLNTAALTVPDLYIQIAAPQSIGLNGSPTNTLGIVGTASWGPVNMPVGFGNVAEYVAAFGPVKLGNFDMGIHVATAVAQGASDFVGVRVTDGTDVASSYALFYAATAEPAILTARYTGTLGNSISIAISTGSKASSFKLTLQLPSQLPEVFDNIDASAGNPTFWANFVSAVNNGTATRGPSQIVTAALGTATTTAPATLSNQTLIGGLDGATNVTATTLIGSDATPRTGMYGLRKQGCSVALLAHATDDTTWTSQVQFGLQEGIYMILTGPNGESISSAATNKASAGVDSYAAKVMLGDWLTFYDTANNQNRLVSAQGFVGGLIANLSPNQSTLNKPLYGIAGSQKAGLVSTGQQATYSSAELQQIEQAGIDVIANPAPGGSYWAVRIGHNSSSNAVIQSDAYTGMTNFLATSLAAGMGIYVGQVITATLFGNIRSTLLGFLGNVAGQNMIGPYAAVCSATNNPQSRTALGYVQADVQVQYLGINEKFIINLQGGASVVIASQGA